MLDIAWRPRAATDLEGILAYIAIELRSPQAAEDCARAIIEGIERAADLPGIGRPFIDEDLERSYRSILVKSYRVFYTHDAETLTVWRIFHTTQDIDSYGL